MYKLRTTPRISSSGNELNGRVAGSASHTTPIVIREGSRSNPYAEGVEGRFLEDSSPDDDSKGSGQGDDNLTTSPVPTASRVPTTSPVKSPSVGSEGTGAGQPAAGDGSATTSAVPTIVVEASAAVPPTRTDPSDADNDKPAPDSEGTPAPSKKRAVATASPSIAPSHSRSRNKVPTHQHGSMAPKKSLPPATAPAFNDCRQHPTMTSRLSCRATNFAVENPLGAVLIGLFVLLLCCFYCCCRSGRREARDAARGEYRAVAAHYTESAFDDTFDEEDDAGGTDDDDDEDDGWKFSQKRTIEMRHIGHEVNGGLTLEEMNG